MSGYQFQLLGGMNIAVNGEAITEISSNRIKLLLAYLILHYDFPHSRKQIAFNFWPDSVEKQALSNLRKLIYDLRECFPHVDRYLKITTSYIQWNDEWICNSDVHDFEQAAQGQTLYELKKAEKLYRGELLPGYYDEWLHIKRETLAQLYVRVLEKLVIILEGRREYSSAIYYANKLLVDHKLSEEYYRMLMRLYALNEDMAGVVTIYERLCKVLIDEFGISPAEESLELFRRLKDNRREAPTANISHNNQPLIGRMNEWKAMLLAWKQAGEGNNSLLILKGEAGVGKTRLAQEFKAWVDNQGFHSAFAGCYPSVRSLSYTPVTSWLRSIPLPPMNVVWLSELVRLLPELYEVYPDLPMPTPIQESWQLNRWYEAIERMLRAHEPLLLIVDDIQWSDKESLQLISYLLRGDSKSKLLVIATMRSDESTNEAVIDTLSNLLIERKLKEIELTSFGMDDTRALMLATVGEVLTDRHSSGLYAETGGNPLFIVETIKEWFTSNDHNEFRHSPLVISAIENRIYRQSDSKRLITTIAAIGRPVSPQFMAQLLHDSEKMINEAMEQLVHHKIMQKAGYEKYDFTHDVVRGVAYDWMSVRVRRDCHSGIAHALIATNIDQPEKIASEVAYHYELAGMDLEAIPYYELSALEAEKMFAHETMIHDYEKICSLLPPEQILPYVLKIGEAWITVGHWMEAETTYRQWIEDCGYKVTIRERSLCDVALANCLRLQGKYEEAKFLLRRAMRHFELLEDLAGRSLVYGTLGILYYFLGDYDKSLHYLLSKLELMDEDNHTKEHCQLFYMMGFLYYDQCDYDQAIHWFKKQIKIAARIHNHHAMGEAMGGLTLVYLDRNELELAFEHVVEKLEISKTIGNRMEFATAIGMMGKYYLYLGHDAYASRCFAYCLEEAIMIKDWRIAAIVVGLEGRSLLERHRYEEAEPLLERALRMFRKLRVPYFICETLHDISVLRQHQNLLDNALEAAYEALDIANRLKRKDMQYILGEQIIRLQGDAQSLSRYEQATNKQQFAVRYHDLDSSELHATAPRPLPQLANKVVYANRISQRMLADIDLYLNV